MKTKHAEDYFDHVAALQRQGLNQDGSLRGNQMDDYRTKLKLFTAEWERIRGYKPAAFQKAIASQRLQRGQSVREIIETLIGQQVQWPD
jgi:hypothetical protein